MRKLLFIMTLALVSFHLEAGLQISELPATVIEGSESGLSRPEGVAFSPSGDCMAVSNTGEYSVTLYQREGSSGCAYATVPFQILENRRHLQYPHEVDFSKNGNFLGVAGRNSHAIVLFKKNGMMFDASPSYIIRGSFSHLNLPASLAFSPIDDLITVANRLGRSTICFYEQSLQREGRYNTSPVFEITDEMLLEYDISPSHGVAFSPDGHSVASVHKKTGGDSVGQSAVVIYERELGEEIKFKVASVLYFGDACLHAVSFHPSGDYLAVAHEREDVMIFKRDLETHELSLYATIPIDNKGCLEGAKGVAFSKTGDCLAITTVEPMVMIYQVSLTED